MRIFGDSAVGTWEFPRPSCCHTALYSRSFNYIQLKLLVHLALVCILPSYCCLFSVYLLSICRLSAVYLLSICCLSADTTLDAIMAALMTICALRDMSAAYLATRIAEINYHRTRWNYIAGAPLLLFL